MALETTIYINGLVSSNPAGADSPAQGDDHLRLIKSTLLATFPAFTAVALASSQAQIDATVLGRLPAGTVAAPGVTLAGDTATGFYSLGGHVFGFSANGVDTVELGPLGINMAAGGLYRAGVAVFPLVAGDIGANAVTTAKILDANVTLAKMANLSAPSVLVGRKTAGAGVPEEIALGAGISLNGSGALIAPAFPPSGTFKNLSIKVATNTTVACAADFVVTTDGTTYQTTAASGTIDLGSNGAVNKLDTGTIAIDSWYFVWAIAKADGTTGWLASLSSTAPTMPTGYTFKARYGAVRTIHASAILFGTWQLGRVAQYVMGLAQTTIPPSIITNSAGTASTTSPVLSAVSVAAVVPSTASRIHVGAFQGLAGGGAVTVLVAPSTAWGGTNNGPAGSNQVIWPIYLNASASVAQGQSAWLTLEATTIGYAAGVGAGGVSAFGWEDNI